MRTFVVLAALIVAPAIAARPAMAAPEGRWCGSPMGMTPDCTLTTLQQCQNHIIHTAGSCYENPNYRAVAAPVQRKPKKKPQRP